MLSHALCATMKVRPKFVLSDRQCLVGTLAGLFSFFLSRVVGLSFAGKESCFPGVPA